MGIVERIILEIECCGECPKYERDKKICLAGAKDKGTLNDRIFRDCPLRVRLGQNLNRKYIETDEFRCSECGIHLEDWVVCTDEENECFGEYEFKYCPNCGVKMEVDNGI